MLEDPAPSRLLFVFPLACAAVTSLVMCSDAERANPLTPEVVSGTRDRRVRLFDLYSQQQPVYPGLPSTETGLHTGTNNTTGTDGENQDAPSIIDPHSDVVNNQNRGDNRRVGIHQRGGETFERADNYHPASATSYKSNPVIRRKSVVFQSSIPSQVWVPEVPAQKSKNPPKTTEDKTTRQPFDSSPPLTPSLIVRHWSKSPAPPPPWRHSGNKERNKLVVVGARSTSPRIQSSKFLNVPSQIVPRAPSISNSLDAFGIKSDPGTEKLPPSVTDFSQGFIGETQRQGKVRPHLLKHTQQASGNTFTSDENRDVEATIHKQMPSEALNYNRFSSQFKQLQRKDPTKEVQHPLSNSNLMYYKDKGAQYGSKVNKYQHTPGGSSRNVNTAMATGQSMKSGFKNDKNPLIFSSDERVYSKQRSFHKGKFKILNTFPSMSGKYSFGRRETPTPDYSSPPPSTLDVPSATTPSPGYQETLDKNPNQGQFRIYRRTYGLRGAGNPPLEGAKAVFTEPGSSGKVLQGFEGFQLRGSQIVLNYTKPETKLGDRNVSSAKSRKEEQDEDLRQLVKAAEGAKQDMRYKKSRKIYVSPRFQLVQHTSGNATNKTNGKYKDKKPGSLQISLVNLKSEGDLNFISAVPKKTNPAPMKKTLFHVSTSSTVRGRRVKGKHKLNESTKNTIGIVRPPKGPARVKAFTYADILGSASFSSGRVSPKSQITKADKDISKHVTPDAEDVVRSGGHSSEDKYKDFSGEEENLLGVTEEEVEGVEGSDAFLDNEGSGSGGFNVSDVLLLDPKTIQALQVDSLELYDQPNKLSTSSKSINMTQTEK